MKESLRFRLDQMSDRFEEVTAMLSEPETMNDNKNSVNYRLSTVIYPHW